MNIIMFSAFVLYFFILIGIAFHFYRKTQTASDFMTGGRSINYWVTAISTQASDMGSWLFLGFPAAVYSNGLFEAWVAIGLVGGMYLNWTYIAPRLRKISESTQANTLSELFSNRFNDTSHLISLFTALLTLLFFTFYIASGLVGLGRVFESVFEMSYHTGIIISLATAAIYTLIGGFVSAAWCALFQGIFLLCVIVFVPTVAFFHINGTSAIIQAASDRMVSLSLFSTTSTMLHALSLAAGWGLGYFGQPHILINFIGIDNPKKINAAKVVGLTWQITVLAAAVCIGIISLAFFKDPVTNPELIFILMTKTLFSPFFAGLALCAIFAATLSTMDRHILISGSVIASDIYKTFLNTAATSKQLLFLSRLSSVGVSLIALAIAWNGTSSVYGLVNYAWSGLGSSFGPLVITALYGKNITKQGALAGLIAGGLTSALWPFGTFVLPLVPGFFINLFFIYFISFLTRKD